MNRSSLLVVAGVVTLGALGAVYVVNARLHTTFSTVANTLTPYPTPLPYGPPPTAPEASSHRSWVSTAHDPLSTFAVDVDNGSFVRARQTLASGWVVAPESVRVEEFVNYPLYDYVPPSPLAAVPFAAAVEVVEHPWRRDVELLRVGLQARQVNQSEREPVHVVFVVDTSGSMAPYLELVADAMQAMLDAMPATDRVTVITYGSGAQVVSADRMPARTRVRLQLGGGTNLEQGLVLGYQCARRHALPGRVVVFSDGLANVGVSDGEALAARVGDAARRGTTLTTVGVGLGGRGDVVLERLADTGDGTYVQIDDAGEARRMLGHHLGRVLSPVARDVKVQLELDPAVVSSYRLVGYDNRRLADSAFRDDRVDGGEVMSGHQVTALYEIRREREEPLGHLRLRWKSPEGGPSVEGSLPLDAPTTPLNSASADTRLAVTLAGFALHLAGDSGAPDLPWIEGSLLETRRPEHVDEDAGLVEVVRTAARRAVAQR